jgi:L-cysteine:1D-myo-inositol 2-amino-2-deoxy-alpha-D-glucopyranoside ligase
VSALREAGIDPMAIRLAILAHHYRQDWDWTDQGLDAAVGRLGRWREAIAVGLGRAAEPASAAGGPARTERAGAESGGRGPTAGQAVLSAIRKRLASDLDAPGALVAVDAWAGNMLAAARSGYSDAAIAGSAALIRDAVDALLGVQI